MSTTTPSPKLGFDLNALGFGGFTTVGALQRSASSIPKVAGDYVIATPQDYRCLFLAKSCGGRFKGRNPSVSKEELESKWVANATTVYIGKAGGGTSGATLRSRLKQYMDFGKGKPVGHWGGRFIWQLADAKSLIVAWKATPNESAANVERDLIKSFKAVYGKIPFANLPNGRKQKMPLVPVPAALAPSATRAPSKRRSGITADFHCRQYLFAQAMQFLGGAATSCMDEPHEFIQSILPEYVLKLFRCGVWHETEGHTPKSVLEELSRWLDGMSEPELMALLKETGWHLDGDMWEVSSDVRAKFFADNQLQFISAWEDSRGIDPENDPLENEAEKLANDLSAFADKSVTE